MFQIKKTAISKNRNNNVQLMKQMQIEFNEARKEWNMIKQDELFMKIYGVFEPYLKQFADKQYWFTDWKYLYKNWFLEDYYQEFQFQLLRRISDYWSIQLEWEWKKRWPDINSKEDWNLLSMWILLIKNVYQKVLSKYKENQYKDAWWYWDYEYFCDYDQYLWDWDEDWLKLEDIAKEDSNHLKFSEDEENEKYLEKVKKIVINFYIEKNKDKAIKDPYKLEQDDQFKEIEIFVMNVKRCDSIDELINIIKNEEFNIDEYLKNELNKKEIKIENRSIEKFYKILKKDNNNKNNLELVLKWIYRCRLRHMKNFLNKVFLIDRKEENKYDYKKILKELKNNEDNIRKTMLNALKKIKKIRTKMQTEKYRNEKMWIIKSYKWRNYNRYSFMNRIKNIKKLNSVDMIYYIYNIMDTKLRNKSLEEIRNLIDLNKCLKKEKKITYITEEKIDYYFNLIKKLLIELNTNKKNELLKEQKKIRKETWKKIYIKWVPQIRQITLRIKRSDLRKLILYVKSQHCRDQWFTDYLRNNIENFDKIIYNIYLQTFWKHKLKRCTIRNRRKWRNNLLFDRYLKYNKK